MKELIPTSVVPPGGLTYTQAETKQVILGSNLNQLIANVTAHRKANTLPVPFNINDEIEVQICESRPELCREFSQKAVGHRPITIDMVLRITSTMIKAGFRRVKQAVADKRALVCVGCEDNIIPQGCTGCNSATIKKAVTLITGTSKTEHDSKLDSCKHCGCFNAAQVWFPLKALQATITEDENKSLPDHCWKKK